MLFTKTQRVGFNYSQNSPSQPQFIASKVAIIDKRNTETKPQVFVLSPESIIETEDLQALKAQFLSGFTDGKFIPMGTLQSVDRKKKLVKLPEQKLVSYEYLVIVTNVKNQQNSDDVHELYTGLNALIDALRIKKNNTFSQHLKDSYSRKLPPALEHKQVQILEDNTPITTPKNKPTANASDWFFESDVILYEVQT